MDFEVNFNAFFRELIANMDYIIYNVIAWLSQFVEGLTL